VRERGEERRGSLGKRELEWETNKENKRAKVRVKRVEIEDEGARDSSRFGIFGMKP